MLKRVAELLGHNAAGNISAGYRGNDGDGDDPLADHVSSSGKYLAGGSRVASFFIEGWLLQQGMGQSALCGGRLLASGEDSNMLTGQTHALGLHKLLQGHIYYRSIMDRVPELAAYSHSNMLHRILTVLKGPPQWGDTSSGTEIYVGHDGKCSI